MSYIEKEKAIKADLASIGGNDLMAHVKKCPCECFGSAEMRYCPNCGSRNEVEE